jgi:hypothetical protein
MSVEQAASAAVEESAPVVEGESQEVVTESAPVVEGEKPQASNAEVKEVIQKIKQLKLKVDGVELIEDLPFEVTPEQAEYLKKELQMSKMSQKRAQEAADLRKSSSKREQELNQFLELLKDKPELILQQMGKDPVALAEQWLQAEVEKMQMDPKDKRIMELEAEMKRVQEMESTAKKAKEEAQAKSLRDKYAADYEKDLMEAMQIGQLPNSPHLINKMVDYMAVAMKAGVDVSFKDLIPLVQEERKIELKPFIEGLSVDELLSLLSEAKVNDLIIKKTPKKKVAPPTAQNVTKDTSSTKIDEGKVNLRNKSAKDFFHKLTMQYAGQD